MNRIEATRELTRKTEEAVAEKATHVTLTVEQAQALLAVLPSPNEISVGDQVTIPDDRDGEETGVVVSSAQGGYIVRPDTGQFSDSTAGLWYDTHEVTLQG